MVTVISEKDGAIFEEETWAGNPVRYRPSRGVTSRDEDRSTNRVRVLGNATVRPVKPKGYYA